MFQKKSSGLREAIAAAVICGALGATPAVAQTAFASSTTIVFPVVANTATFTTTVTLYNPNSSDVTVGLDYFDANNTAVPGQKPCNDVVVPANGSVAFTLASECTLDPTTSHFGPLVASDNALVSQIFGYSRTENNKSAGFSIEGFPSEDLTTNTTNVIGLRGSTAPIVPAYQTNCFVTAQAVAITYDMKLFDGATHTQIGSTVSGSLGPFEQIRYTDVFSPAPNGVNAPAATDFSNVRAEFTRTSAGERQMVAFCTVQDNATLGADFRIAKALVVPPPPPPVGTLVPAGTWAGDIIPSIVHGSPLAFIGPTKQVPLTASKGLSAYGGGWFAKQSSGAGPLDLGVCYQDTTGPGPVTLMGPTTAVSVPHTGDPNSPIYASAAGSAGSVPAGTYNVGLCGQNPGSNDINRSTQTIGFVFVGS